MNYLAHAYLSFNIPEILAGNMLSDFIKGKKKFDFPKAVQQGIALHRAIDTFTDYHESTQVAKEFFRPAYRLYSGAFVDVIYDHFLANDTNQFPDRQSLLDFSYNAYNQLSLFSGIFPERFGNMFPYMKMQNWLYNYRYRKGMQHSLQGVVNRASYMFESQTAYHLFEKHYEALKNCYDDFFPSLKKFAKLHLQQLIEN
jgi:acyl carrier protein phosphodiesterase